MPTLTFTTSGTWQALAATVDCQCTAEGGDGSASVSVGGHDYGGGGGGGGEYAEETTLALTVGSNCTYTIGQGGSSTNTSFPGNSVTVLAHYGGTSPGYISGGTGGTGSTNYIHYNGTAGQTGNKGSTYPAGDGGAAAGPGGTGTGGAGGIQNAAGSAPGGGGGGGGGGDGRAGGVGGAGQIVIIYTSGVTGTATLTGVGTLTATANVLSPTGAPGQIRPGMAWLRRFGYGMLHRQQPGNQIQTLTGTATLTGTGTLTAQGAGPPAPGVVNVWSGGYGQGTTFTSITSALQSCVVNLVPGTSVWDGSGYPSAGNWLFTVASWTQDPQIINVHTGVSDDIHSWWRQFPAGGSGGYSRTSVCYTPNLGRPPQYVYLAPDMEIAAVNVLVIEVAGLGPWDTVSAMAAGYAGAATSLNLAVAAPGAASFFLAGIGGDDAAAGQAFAPAGWTQLPAQSQSNGVNDLADNVLSAAFLSSSSSSQSVTGTASAAENLSGFLIGVEVAAASPIPAGSNPDWPHVVFEAGFGSGFNTPDSEVTWTDLSGRLWNYSETTGIQYQLGQLQATNLTLELDNYDSALSPDNESSPYYPNVTSGTPIRLRMALGTIGGQTVNRWYTLQRNVQEWNEGITDFLRKYCYVTGTDMWASLSSVPPTFYRSEVYEDAPYAWWPCDDQPGTSNVLPTYLLNAAEGNTSTLDILLSPAGGQAQLYLDTAGHATAPAASGAQTATAGYGPGIAIYAVGTDEGWMFGDPQGTAPTLGTGNPVTSSPGSAAWQASGQAGSTGGYGWFLSCNDTGFPALSAGITIECWFSAQYYAGPTAWTIYAATGNLSSADPITQQPHGSPITLWEIATGTAPVCLLQLDASGHLNLVTYSGSTGTSNSIYTGSDLRSSSWHMVTVTLTETAWQVWLDGGANATAAGTATGMTSAWSWIVLNGDMGSGGGGAAGSLQHGGNISLAHIAVYPHVLPYFRVMDHYWAAVTAFGQLPAPVQVQAQWTDGVYALTGSPQAAEPAGDFYVPDGSAGGATGGYASQDGIGVSAVVTATAPGGVTSGPSAWTAAATAYATAGGAQETTYDSSFLWVSWTGLAPSFSIYTAPGVGSEAEAAAVAGAGDSFTSGYGAGASGKGVAQVSGGTGAAPPAQASAIGDTVGQRIERLMRAGRCTSPQRSIDPAASLVQAPGNQGGGIQTGASIQSIQQSDSGMLFTDNCGNLCYWMRPHLASQYSSPVWAIGPAAGQVPYYREIRWITDPQRIWNAITIAPLSPSGAELPLLTPSDATAVDLSQRRYGAQPLQIISWLQSQEEMQAQANWLFSYFGTPTRHAEEVRIDASAYPAAWPLVAGVNVSDLVTVEDWAIGGGGATSTFRVTQIRRKLIFGGHTDEVEASVELICDFEPDAYYS